ncbi:beta-1,3-galactosyltransferase 6-like [Sycon ciliatum]|uniref:beta-1,3-galactosyltransferase 6-like n=1 Tax=Sycon ciliatum TaxID=27933 RepID=UPI0031F62B47|eukprot:scpid61360/ scgid9605/ Beta-1,3-galactosyltransferase 6; GAG GalTII; Galactosyltransferase II; Galactosylxylosylprotein 3-beta-galactosyltransferase; UDP-Gal:betaGal beta 1,3-galactosyltransferase polypeptide 6
MALRLRFCRPLGIVRNPMGHLYLVLACAFIVVLSLLTLSRITQSNSLVKSVDGVGEALLADAKDDEESLVLLIAVLSSVSAEGAERRNAVRSSWMSLLPARAEVLFFVGGLKLESAMEQSIQESLKTQSDLILLPDVRDTYAALTDKVLAVSVWATKNRRFRFMLKSDDDTFLRPDVMVAELSKRPPTAPPLYWGFFDGRHAPKHHGQWAERNYVLCDRYITYAKGGAYVLDSSLVAYIARNRDMLVKFNSEDVSVGTWLAPIAVDRQHDPRFDTEYISRGCDNRFIAMHKQSAPLMAQLALNYRYQGVLCSTESRKRGSYIYNWTVPPSQCCKRGSLHDKTIP